MDGNLEEAHLRLKQLIVDYYNLLPKSLYRMLNIINHD